EHGEAMRGALVPRQSNAVSLQSEDAEHARYRLDLTAAGVALEAGYHRLEIAIDGDARAASSAIIVAPARVYRPPALSDDSRVWGFALQLYAVRSRRNWGSGDFGDLRALVDFAAGSGADVVALNPLHALHPTEPARASPYSPSSRLF